MSAPHPTGPTPSFVAVAPQPMGLRALNRENSSLQAPPMLGYVQRFSARNIITMARRTANIDIKGGKLQLVLNILLRIFLAFNPLILLLRYLMTFVVLYDFVADRGHHPSTSACDAVVGLEGIDTLISLITTFFAFIILQPGIYTIACVLQPGLPHDKHLGDYLTKHNLTLRNNVKCSFETGRLVYIYRAWRHATRLFSIDLGILRLLHIWSENLNKRLRGATDHPLTRAELTMDGIFYAKDSDQNEWEKAWVPEKELPFYGQFIKDVREEIPININPRLCPIWIQKVFKTAIAFIPLFQLLTPTGRYSWTVVLWKYCSFALVSCGVWTENCCDNFKLEQKVDEFLHNDPAERRENIYEFVGSVVGLRAVIWMIIPQLTALSVYSLQTSATPIIVLSKEMSKIFPSMIAFDAYTLAKEAHPHTKWKQGVLTISIFLKSSRLIQLLISVTQYFMTISMTFINPNRLSGLVLMVLLVTVLDGMARATDSLLYLGDFIGVEDYDFHWFPESWYSKPTRHSTMGDVVQEAMRASQPASPGIFTRSSGVFPMLPGYTEPVQPHTHNSSR